MFSNYIITYKIRQQTPLIHHQADEKGVGIRPTELKSKLDKFIKQEKFPNKKPPSDLLIGYNYKNNEVSVTAFDYKVVIKNPEKNNEFSLIGKRQPLFFGNMAAENAKKFIFFNELIEVSFKSKNKEILKILNEHSFLNAFFASTNFGTRQGKGFGSFLLDDYDETFLNRSYDYYFKINKDNQANLKQNFKYLFEDLQLFYKAIRAGINIKEGGRIPYCEKKSTFYFKSLLFLYFKENHNVQWEKKTVKEKWYGQELKKQPYVGGESDCIKFSSKEKYIVRDLLGLAKEETWLTYRGNKHTKEHIHAKDQEVIERFPSPIFFKIVNNHNDFFQIFIRLRENNEISGEHFYIKNSYKYNRKIKLEAFPGFDIKDYFGFIYQFAQKDKIDSYVDEDFHENDEFHCLKDIFQSLNKTII